MRPGRRTALTIIGSNNGLSPGRRQAIIWTNAVILSIGPLGTNFNEILIEIYIFIQENVFENVVRKMASILSRPQCVKCWWHADQKALKGWSFYKCFTVLISFYLIVRFFPVAYLIQNKACSPGVELQESGHMVWDRRHSDYWHQTLT